MSKGRDLLRRFAERVRAKEKQSDRDLDALATAFENINNGIEASKALNIGRGRPKRDLDLVRAKAIDARIEPEGGTRKAISAVAKEVHRSVATVETNWKKFRPAFSRSRKKR